jgi:hypothetical protein
LNVPEDARIDDEAIGDFRKLAHERGVDPKTAQELLDLQLGLVKRANDAVARHIQGMTDNNFKTFLNDDCNGDKELAGVRMEQVKRYLQTFCVDKDGQPDPVMWEKFQARTMYNDRMIELPLLRALHQAAQMGVGTGGAPTNFGTATKAKAGSGGLDYPEMDNKK